MISNRIITELIKSNKFESAKNLWSTEACGTQEISGVFGRREFFEEYRNFRYRTIWYIPLYVPFTESQGKKVLEIGCGNGADGAMFATNGAHYTGVDLTQTAIDATKEHFQILDLPGKFQIENAEHLSFPEDSFDIVYSMGVLHHTSDTQQAIDEVLRVLKPEGKAIIMLYYKDSFNYYFRIMLYMRVMVFLKILSRLGRWNSDRETINSDELVGLRGNKNNEIWDIHYRNFLREGWGYLSPENFVNHCTDGPECPLARVYTKKGARNAFSHFSKITMQVTHFPLRSYRWGKWIPLGVEKFLGSVIGWNLLITALK